MRYLTEDELVELISDRDVFALVSQAFEIHGRDRRVASRPAAAFMVAEHPLPVLLPLKGAVATRLNVAGVLVGAQHGDYVLLVLDSRSGQIRGIVEQARAIKRRTAASALAAARLAGAASARVAAVIGAGQIARELIRLLPQALPTVETVRVAARSQSSASRLVATCAQASRPRLTAEATPADALAGADVVFTVTSASTPIIGTGLLSPGMTVCALGGGPEISIGALSAIDRLLVDDPDYALTRGTLAGWVHEGSMTREAIVSRIDADFGQLQLGCAVGREHDSQTVLAVVQGMAICDLVIADEALRRAEMLGIGRTIPIAPQSARDPAPASSSAKSVIDSWSAQ
ncbi:MAG: hypothetical protein AB7P21_26325 [Lautropia sp.]